MFRLLRYFSITSLVAFIIVIVLLANLYSDNAIEDLEEIGESRNVALTRALANSIWPDFRLFLKEASQMDGDALRAHPETGRLRQSVMEQTAGQSILKVKLYDMIGTTIFSTEAAQIGEDKSDNAGYLSALSGRVASELAHRDTFSAFEGMIVDRDVLSSYIPIYSEGTSGEVEGVFEIYSDLTPLLQRIERTQQTLVLTLVAILSLLYLALFFIVHRAERIIQSQAADLVQAKEAAERANQAKSEFTAFVAHELKTPITVIRLYLDLVTNAAANALSAEKYRDVVTTNVDRMSLLASDLTDISRLETGSLRLKPKAIAPHEVLEDVRLSIQQLIEGKQQTLTLNLADGLPPVWADEERLIQIITNLVSNAHKYTPIGGNITVSASPIVEDNGCQAMQISVQDNGIGIRASEQERLFQRFFRSEDEQARRAEGTGLGLNIAKHLVELQKGRIWFESNFRQGTTFYFTLPVAAAC